MSHIFDGLQRLEDERPGSDASAPSGVTELLQLAERHAVSKWGALVQSASPEATDVKANELFNGAVNTRPQFAVEWESQALAEPSLGDSFAAPFSQFQSLRPSPPSQSRLAAFMDRESPAAEAFNLLGVRLRHLKRVRTLKKVLITSTIPQEGKSMVSANLACTLALKTQHKILVLEGDLRRPSLSQIFGLERQIGLSEVLENGRSLAASIYHLEGPDLWILPAGKARNNALELLQSDALSALMDQLVELFDWIIIDSPPILPLADTSIWMRTADGIILTTRQGVTQKRELQRGLEAIDRGKLVGALVNSSKHANADNYYYAPQTSRRTD